MKYKKYNRGHGDGSSSFGSQGNGNGYGFGVDHGLWFMYAPKGESWVPVDLNNARNTTVYYKHSDQADSNEYPDYLIL